MACDTVSSAVKHEKPSLGYCRLHCSGLADKCAVGDDALPAEMRQERPHPVFAAYFLLGGQREQQVERHRAVAP